MTGSEQDSSERVITNLYSHGVDDDIVKTIYWLWDEFKWFQGHAGIYGKINHWNILDARKEILASEIKSIKIHIKKYLSMLNVGLHQTCSSPRRAVHSHSLVCIKISF